MEPPLASKQCRVDDDDPGDAPGFFFIFQLTAMIHQLLGNAALQQVHPNNVNAPNIPPQGANAAQTFQAFADFIDDVALEVGMTPANITKKRTKPKRPRPLPWPTSASG